MARGRKKREIIIMPNKSPDTVKDEMVATTKELVSKQYKTGGDFLKWSELQHRLYALILSEIEWDKSDNKTVLELNAENVVKKLNWRFEGNLRVAAQSIVKTIKDMVEHSNITIENPYTGEWFKGHMITKAYGKGCVIYIEIEPQIMPHLEDLYHYSKYTSQGFLAYMSGDVLDFSSGFSYPLYLELALKISGRNIIETHEIPLTRIRELCGLENDEYMKVNPKTGQRTIFDKTNFNKRVIKKFIEDINNSEMMEIFPNDNGNYFEEIKAGGSLFSYRFKYMVRGQFEMEKNRAKALLESKELPKTKENLELLEELERKALAETNKNKWKGMY